MDTLLTSMELTASEAKEEVNPEANPPKYPWGLCIDLDEDALKKLGITTLPEIGETMSLVAKVEVQSTSQYQDQGAQEQRKNVSLQITDMSLSPAASDAAKVLYRQ